jgi:hypothetical protein
MSDETLLKKFQPCMRYDSLETYFADSAEEWTLNPRNVLRRPDGTVLARAGDQLSLDFLRAGTYPTGQQVRDTDLIEAATDDYQDQYRRLRRDNQHLRNVIYGRVVRQGAEVWLQYWFYYFFNDYLLAWGLGTHEGDWEMIQLKLDGAKNEDEAKPTQVVYAQHNFCEVRDWDGVTTLAMEKQAEGVRTAPGDERRPLVYVGRGSHASFFTPGYHPTDFYDVTDGRRRPKTDVKLEIVSEGSHPWLRWPGRWGGSRGGGKGPEAPCSQSQWDDPDSLLKRDPVVARAEPAPDEPRVWARRRRGRLLIDFDFSPMAVPARRLIATVNPQDEPTVPPKAFRLALKEVVLGSLQTRIELKPDAHYDVSVAVVDAAGRATRAQIFVFHPSKGLLGLRRRLTAAAGRAVHLIRLALRGSSRGSDA